MEEIVLLTSKSGRPDDGPDGEPGCETDPGSWTGGGPASGHLQGARISQGERKSVAGGRQQPDRAALRGEVDAFEALPGARARIGGGGGGHSHARAGSESLSAVGGDRSQYENAQQ
jgi:hypothetical protein